MLNQGEISYYDRALINYLFRSGMNINHDLEKLHRMSSYLKKYDNLSKSAHNRLKWFDYYNICNNVAKTCRHFDISRKTFYKWKKKYDPFNLNTLEDSSTAPKVSRKPEITWIEEQRIISLRKKYICYSKIKLSVLYERLYNDPISSWKIQRIIQKYKLYPNPAKTAKITKKRLNAKKKRRITELKKKKKAGFLLCLDTIEIRAQNLKRFIFTAIDNYSKVAFARMYKQDNSYNANDFLNRLMYLIDGKIDNIQTDNGSEFAKYFELGCQKFDLDRYYSRPRTPKDNPVIERFNQTLQKEFINLGNYDCDPNKFNRMLTEWLIEYNFVRPHDSLNNQTPIKITKVLPMYPSCTYFCFLTLKIVE
jgi:transposase InsO family protein